ncbi:MAG: ATP-binding protein [Lentimicrobium sp.]|jgi:signal transduction histidine kinase|nr:ATP-binding protein [Lentimicrobium sp.]
MKPLSRKHYWWLLLLLALLLATLAEIVQYHTTSKQQISQNTTDFSATLNERYKKSAELLSEVKALVKAGKFNEPEKLDLPENYNLFVFEQEQLVYWSDNDYFPDIYSGTLPRILKTGNGFYQLAGDSSGNTTFVIGDLIKQQYPYQNDYLSAGFNPVYNLAPSVNISQQPSSFAIKDESGEVLFYLNQPDVAAPINAPAYILFYLLSFLLITLSLYYLYRQFPLFGQKAYYIFLFLADVIILRWVQFYFEFPSKIYQTELFNPFTYATSVALPSLGDLLINTLFGLIGGWLFFNYFTGFRIKLKGRFQKLVSLVYLSLVILLFFLISMLIDSLTINSTFEMNFSNILEFSVYSYIAFFIIAGLLFSFFLFTYPLLRLVYKSVGNKFLLLNLLVLLIFFNLVFHLAGFSSPDYFSQSLFLIYTWLLWLTFRHLLSFPSVSSIGLLVVVLTILSSYSHYKNQTHKEQNERHLLAVRLASNRDKMAEYLYNDIAANIMADTTVKRLIASAYMNADNEESCKEYIEKFYLSGYWFRYNVQITLCFPEKMLSVKPRNMVISCNDYFDRIISMLGEPTASSTLFYIRESYNASSYISKINIPSGKGLPVETNVIIELNEKNVSQGMGYLELLLDRSVKKFNDLTGYSYAIYVKGELVRTLGEYPYSMLEDNYARDLKDGAYFDRNGYNHLFYNVDTETSIIVSRPKDEFLDLFAPFTYQFAFHILLILLITVLTRTLNSTGFRHLDLKTRLQLMLVGIILFSSLIIGLNTIRNISKLNSQKNRDMLSEKAHSVLIEMEHKLSDADSLTNQQNEYLDELLTKFSLVFFTDINLYAPDGSLLSSSRPQIFDQGIKSPLMSQQAFIELSGHKRTRYLTNENIGHYQYLSAYLPFRNSDNKLIAYINLPYFARQQELREEISSFLVAFLNIYILLTVFAIGIALLVGIYFTRPLQLIRNRFSSIKFGVPNEQIEYNRNDELGDLIKEYNFMIDKLAESAEQLARSERESAWREMARQVAHEIKNPLTPMKLSIQHLFKSYRENAPDWHKRLESTTRTLIFQIDSLSDIATAFSDFAKLPQAHIEKIDLTATLLEVMRLFKDLPSIQIVFNQDREPRWIMADEKQLTRLFVNLIKNAVQAIPTGRDGVISIILTRVDQFYRVEIADNGSGMAPEEQIKVFSPNFTTKSGGMGLGLAMARNIVTSLGGEITFKSHLNEGTSFYVELPVADQLKI